MPAHTWTKQTQTHRFFLIVDIHLLLIEPHCISTPFIMNDDEELSTDDQLRVQARAHKKAEQSLQDQHVVQSVRGTLEIPLSKEFLTYFRWMIPRRTCSQNKSHKQRR